ncbi:MAG: sulfatase [Phenylobacterium sp.]|nr:sulfatase [Phenylobacterium sp.]
MGLAATGAAGGAGAATRPLNVIVVLTDDLGWGDLGSYGSKLIRTPNLDRMARQGVRMTDFYASANICTPSRAGLLTGRYPIRSGLAHEVIQPPDTHGLKTSETTLAKALKPDYATALIGKWHLGHAAPSWPPTNHGFDLFSGLPYSHDMKPLAYYEGEAGGDLAKEDEVDLPRLTERFFARSRRFIEDNRDRPFFLLLALTAPHLELLPHPDHKGRSRAAAYGDVVEEVDAEMGRLLEHLKTLSLDRQTLVIFTSDNGPWFEGSAGPMRDRKGGASWDGGYRVPFVAWAPGRLPAGRVIREIAMNIDILPTVLAMAGRPLPPVELDGRDLTPTLTQGAASPHDTLLMFNNEQLAAIRTDRWKYVVRSYYRRLDLPWTDRYGPMLFDVRADPAEAYNLASLHPDVVADLKGRFDRAKAAFEPLGTRYKPPA